LIREEKGGYVVERVVFENVIRIRRVAIPTQAAYVAFFGCTLVITSILLRPNPVNSLFFLAVIVNGSALGISLYEMVKTLKRL